MFIMHWIFLREVQLSKDGQSIRHKDDSGQQLYGTPA